MKDCKLIFAMILCLISLLPAQAQIGTVQQGLSQSNPVYAGSLDAIGKVNGGCTGTLIDQRTVLTAAHCVCNQQLPVSCSKRANFTLENVLATDGSGKRIDITIAGNVYTHPEYLKKGWLRDDYAMIILDEPVWKQAQVTTIPVEVPQLAPSAGDCLTLVGYGTTGEECKDGSLGKRKLGLYPTAVDGGRIFFKKKGLHACPGDSGGPTINLRGNVVGVASWTNQYDESTYRPTHTVYHWIQQFVDIKEGSDKKPDGMFRSVAGVGHVAEGAGMVIGQIDFEAKPDMILMAYDAPNGQNNFRYKIGKNIDGYGQTERWTKFHVVPGVGGKGEGAGIAMTDLDNNGRPDLILMAYDGAEGANEFRYRVGKNIDANGNTRDWSEIIRIPGVGHLGEGAGIAIYDIDGNTVPDLVLMAYDAPNGANQFRYKIGWNIGSNGIAKQWSPYHMIAGVGQQGDGAGISIGDINQNGRPDILLTAYDAPNGKNEFRYRIGWDIGTDGTTNNWNSYYKTVPGVGHEGEGADVALFDIDQDGQFEGVFMAYDAPNGPNEFRYTLIEKLVIE